MLRRVTMAAVVAVVAAAMAAPAALAQDDYSTSQVKYGDDVYGGTEGSTDSATSSAGQSGGGAWTKFSAKLTGSNEVGGGDPNGNINNLPLNSGIQTGTVFNETPYGEVPGNTPQVLIQRPGSGRIIPLNREITVRVRFSNFEPGHFSDPKAEYGVGTQRLNAQGSLEGHNHGCFQRVARDGSVPAETCDSFVVLSQDGTSDILTGIMPPLTRAGRYRFCADAAAENHYPAARAFAQRGGPMDCVRVLAMDFSQLRRANG